MLIQLQQPDIQEKFLAKYSFLNKSDFSNIDQFIGKMRNYVQTSKDQKTAELEVVEVLQGRANAQQALQNLLMAQPELWNQITSAVGKTGSTQELYDKITANTGDTITKIKNDLMILAVQFGEVLGIILPPVEKVLSIITSIVVALPLPIKIIIGLILIAAVAVGTFLVALLGLIGAMAVMIANTEFMILTTGQLDLSINQITLAFTNFYRQILVSSGALTALKANMASFTLTTQVANGSVLAFVKNMSGMTAVTLGFAGATIGFMAQTELMHKQMYSEARLISLLTSIWIAYATAKAAASLGLIGLPGLIAGLAVGSAYLVWSQAQISDYEQKEYATFQRNKMGLNKGTGMTKNYNLNIANASINSEGMPLDDFVSAMTDTGEEY
jgi:hypothetical protein